MSAVALVVGLICLVFVRDLETSAAPATRTGVGNAATGPAWTPRQAVFTMQFAVLTAALALTMTAVTTINGIVVTHLAKLGLSPATGAWALGALSFTGTLMKGATGHLCESKSPKAFVILGLLCQAAGCALLIVSTTTIVAFAAAILFGAGWAFALVAGWVVLMRYFGGPTGARILAIVQLVTTVGAAGPIGAGIIADRWGTFTPIFAIYAIVLFGLTVPVALVRPPALHARKAAEYEPAVIAAEPA
jgi:MFS family permease